MAIRTLRRTRLDSRRETRLRKGIVAEMERPDDTSASAAGPVIYQEESRAPEHYTHWYVIWDQFDGVDGEDRSRVIMDAVEQVFGRAAALRVTTAMGLTPDDPVAQDIAGHSEAPTPVHGCASVAETRAKYGKTKRAHNTQGTGG